MKYLIIDTETTGLFDYKKPAHAPGQPRLASAHFIYTDEKGAVIESNGFLVKPDDTWTDEDFASLEDTTNPNVLTRAHLEENGAPISNVLAEYTRAIEAGLVVVAYNASFDLKVFRAELRRAEMDDLFAETQKLCVMQPMRKEVGKMPKLEEALAHIGVTLENAHTAKADTEGARKIFVWLLERGKLNDKIAGLSAKPVDAPKPEAKPAPKRAVAEASAPVPTLTAGTDLLPIENVNKELFNAADTKALDELLAQIRTAAMTGENNLETDAGRKAIASRARAVSNSKGVIEKAGVAIVSEWKAKAKVIDARRKRSKDYLDALRDEVRKPLTDWEAKKAEAEAAEDERIRAELVAAEIAEREKAEAEAAAKREELERREADLAAREAKLNAAEAAASQKALEEAKAIERENEAKEAEARTKAAAERAEREKAEAVAEAEQRARRDALAEAQRAEAEAKAKAANVEHRRTINQAAVKALAGNGINEAGAIQLVKAIAAGSIPQISMNY